MINWSEEIKNNPMFDNIIEILSDSNFLKHTTHEVKDLAEKILKKTYPLCNQCGEHFNAKIWETITVKQSWGYESTGKDTDVDNWQLCKTCSEKFNLEFSLSCTKCNRSILDVTALLASQSSGCSFYGDFEAAKQHFSSDRHCGLPYAVVNNRVICEICYEELVCNFKKPVPEAHYLIGIGEEYTESERSEFKNRISRTKEFRDEKYIKDAISESYFAYCTYEEAVKIKKSPNKHELAIRLSWRILDEKKKDYGYENLTDWGKKVTLETGDKYWDVMTADLPKQHKINPTGGIVIEITPNFKEMAIEDCGQTLVFGEYKIATKEVLKLAKPRNTPGSDSSETTERKED